TRAGGHLTPTPALLCFEPRSPSPVSIHRYLFTPHGASYMSAYLPAQIGMPLSEVVTPALILELDPFERNLDSLARSLSGKTVKVRPHAKSHKCPQIALAQ